MKSTRNFARHPLGLIMVLVNFISVATFVLEPVAHAQVTGDSIPTGSLNTPRVGHTATLLPNGKVLVAAGYNGTGFLSSAELYDPASGTWSITGSLNAPRYYPTATLLTNGKVLVVGWDNSGGGAELYDPATGTWSVTGNLLVARSDHAATLLPNGKVLIAGGVIGYTDFDLPITVNDAELYDPGHRDLEHRRQPQHGSRGSHGWTLLQNGKVLVAGGWDGLSYGPSAELYDPVTGIWSYTGNLNISHYGDTATLLANGQVLVVGGFSTNYAELYDPATATWRFTDAPNSGGAATLLPMEKFCSLPNPAQSYMTRPPVRGASPPTPTHLTILVQQRCCPAAGLSCGRP